MTAILPGALGRVLRRRGIPRLAWREAGEGRPLLLIHGFPADGRVFTGQLDAASGGDLGAHVIAPDLPGFGLTPAVGAPDGGVAVLEVADLVEAVIAFIAERRLERPVVGGVAIGGYIAIELAAEHPDLVAGLVLIGTKPAPDAPANGPRREAVAQLALERGAAAVADELGAEPFAPGASPNAVAAFRRMIEDADPRGIAGLVRGLHRRPDPTSALEMVRAVALPALVLVGSEDPFTKPADARRLADMLPGATFEEIPGAGHLPPLERPEAVTSAIARFLATIP